MPSNATGASSRAKRTSVLRATVGDLRFGSARVLSGDIPLGRAVANHQEPCHRASSAGRAKCESFTNANWPMRLQVELTGARRRWRERLDLLCQVPSHSALPQRLGTE